MSLIPHSIFPRRMMDLNSWMAPLKSDWSAATTLDLFDPFDELDTLMSQDIDWISKPEFLPIKPDVQQKYRIMVECPGFVPKKDAIKTDVKNNVLTVSGREEDKQEGGDFSVREFKKTYKLPENVQHEKMISFMPVEGTLVLEFPLKETTGNLNEDLMPRIVETSQGGKAVTINFGVPKNIEPSKVHVVIKDRDLIVKADDISKDKYTTSKIHYYKRATLPPNTDFERLQCKWDDNNKISCTAPLKTEVRAVRNVPIEQPLKLTK